MGLVAGRGNRTAESREKRSNLATMMTDDITRLRGEIITMRKVRDALMDRLVRDVKERNRSVFQFRAHNRSAHAEMAKRTKTERLAFLRNWQRELQRDLAGARRAWAGAS